MKKTLFFLLIFSASHVFSQNSIDWISLEQAKEKAKFQTKIFLYIFIRKLVSIALKCKKKL